MFESQAERGGFSNPWIVGTCIPFIYLVGLGGILALMFEIYTVFELACYILRLSDLLLLY